MERLLQALAQAADGAFVVNAARRIVYWNPAAETLTGFTQADVRAHSCYEMLGGTDEQGRLICRAQCWVAVTSLQGRPVDSFDTAIRTKSGQVRWVNMSSFAYLVGGGESVLVHLFRDVSQTKQTQQFVQELRQRMQQLEDAGPTQTTQARDVPDHQALTPREQEVLSLLVRGHSTNEMAQTLVISPATVRNHIRHILSKLGVHSRLEAVAYAFKYGLLADNQD